MCASILSGSLLTKVLLDTKQTQSAKRDDTQCSVKNLHPSLMCSVTQVPGSGKETPTDIEGQPVSVCSMWIRSELGFSLRICDIQKKRKVLLQMCGHCNWWWMRLLQHSPINGSPSDTYNTSSSLLGAQTDTMR